MASRNGSNGGRRKIAGPSVSTDLGPVIRIEPRGSDESGPCIKIVLDHGSAGREPHDLTRAFTSAIAHSLWMARAGDDAQNWIDAEHLLEQAFGAKRPVKHERRETTLRDDARTSGPLPEPDLLNRIRRATIGT
jgi:hypothetical protein